ncbi:MAG: S1 RNA-binding domain-containing protein, partial [Haliscomenobacter sp.]|uniref:S1 RNA-binding domain-containing protein n=1 Tax=Haliscomenobacter sp. TaxID=2717303 RepID=UPI0029ADEC33
MIDEKDGIEQEELGAQDQVEETAVESTPEIVDQVEEVAAVAEEVVEETTEEVEAVVEETVVVAEEVAAAADEPLEEVAIEPTPEPVVIIKSIKDEPEATTGEEEEEDELDEELLFDSGFDPNSAHDEFDWSITNKGGAVYSSETTKEYLTQYESTMNAVVESEIVKGRVTSINGGDVVLDINYKSDGLVPLSEFRDTQDLKIGDFVEVYVEQQEDLRGQLVLSRRKAKLLRAWESIVDSYENGTVIKGTVISKTKGGLIVDCSGLETFLPGS